MIWALWVSDFVVFRLIDNEKYMHKLLHCYMLIPNSNLHFSLSIFSLSNVQIWATRTTRKRSIQLDFFGNMQLELHQLKSHQFLWIVVFHGMRRSKGENRLIRMNFKQQS